jgi:hypothetical protein
MPKSTRFQQSGRLWWRWLMGLAIVAAAAAFTTTTTTSGTVTTTTLSGFAIGNGASPRSQTASVESLLLQGGSRLYGTTPKKRYGAEVRKERRALNRQRRNERAKRVVVYNDDDDDESTTTEKSSENKIARFLKWPFRKLRRSMTGTRNQAGLST